MPNKTDSREAWHSFVTHNVLIVWKPEYNLGIPIVDEQHRGIVTTINSLYYAMQYKHGDEMLQPVVDMIGDYTRIHFEIEEDFLRKCSYPDLAGHHALHDELMDTLSSIGKKSLWDKDPQEFLDFLKKWWIDHICKRDRVFCEYLAKASPNLKQ